MRKTAAALLLAGSPFALGLAPATQPTPRWTVHTSTVTARLRGISAVSDRVVWASGAAGTVIRTTDGGGSWQALRVPDSGTLDFRDIDAIDDRTAYVLSIGPGDASRIYKTTDAGINWTLQFRNDDSIAFRDARHGIVVGGDYKDERGAGSCAVSEDGGATWREISGLGGFRSAVAFVSARGPTAVAVGPSGSDYSEDGGRTWRAIEGPGFHTMSVPRGSRTVWAAGENGAVGQLRLP